VKKTVERVRAIRVQILSIPKKRGKNYRASESRKKTGNTISGERRKIAASVRIKKSIGRRNVTSTTNKTGRTRRSENRSGSGFKMPGNR